MSRKSTTGTWTEGRLSVEYERFPGEPRTKGYPGTEDGIELLTIMVNGDDIGGIVDVLEHAGIYVYEELQNVILGESAP